jgi:hypothetical protein
LSALPFSITRRRSYVVVMFVRPSATWYEYHYTVFYVVIGDIVSRFGIFPIVSDIENHDIVHIT